MPRGVADVVRTRSVDVPAAATGLTVNVAVDEDGSPAAESVTPPVKPPVGATETTDVAVWPRVTVTEVGAAESEKSRAVTTSVIAAECTTAPLVPVTVSG